MEFNKLIDLQKEILEKYATRPPKQFLQIDCFGPKFAGDYVVDPYGDGVGIMGQLTWELMHGVPVRILISEDYDDPKVLADLLESAARWVRESSMSLRSARRDLEKQQPIEDELPF